jgi:lipoprotein-anchoring transpeptidase ErfK/SrfK
MKKKIAMLFVVIMILSMPVMAGTVSADAAGSAPSVEVQAAKSGWVKSGSTFMYYVNGKAYKSGIYWINGKRYGFDATGKLCKGWFKLNNHTYYASAVSGAKGFGEVLTGYRKIGNKYYYLDPNKSGMRRCGFIWIGGKLYFFSSVDFSQRRTKGWFFIGNTMYYVKSDGTIATNTTIDGYKIGGDGAVKDISGMDSKAQGYSSNTRYLILVDKKNHKVSVYQGSKGKWAAVRRNMICTTGKSSTPSPSGSFRLDHKSSRVYGYKDFGGSTVFYATRITAGNYFHSILYRKGCRNPYTHSPKDATLGKSKSNSCIRLSVENAKYIHQVTPRNTRVIVY